MVREDCFGISKHKSQCSALNKLYCKTGGCAFYQSAEEYRRRRLRYMWAEEAWREQHEIN